jgi:hypothetical protein
MAGKYGSQSITITYDDGPGGTARAVTGHVLTMSGVKIESIQEASDAFGDSWEEHTPVGKEKMEPVTLSGHWDTTATTGPHVVFIAPDNSPQDATRTLTMVFGDSKQLDVETRLVSYEVLGENGALTKFTAVIQPTGTATWS